MPRVSVLEGNCLDVMRELPAESFDSCVTDPPYHLKSIVKRFGATAIASGTITSTRARARADSYARHNRGFFGQRWDGGSVAFDPATWAEVLRVLKPGAFLVAFGATRTYHRLACAIEDSGFEVRDMLAWLYGSGFTKSKSVPHLMRSMGTSEAEALARQWIGWGTHLKPAIEPIVFARKPLVGTIAANVLAFGTGGLNIDASRIEAERETGWGGGAFGGGTWNDETCGLAKEGTPRPSQGRFPANIMHDGSAEVVERFEVDDFGSTSRFYYCAKADEGDRLGSEHPTVKPVDLIAWLVRLTTPRGGAVLDPFAGSGTTAMACLRLGMSGTMIEREAAFARDIRRRITHVDGRDLPLFAEATS